MYVHKMSIKCPRIGCTSCSPSPSFCHVHNKHLHHHPQALPMRAFPPHSQYLRLLIETGILEGWMLRCSGWGVKKGNFHCLMELWLASQLPLMPNNNHNLLDTISVLFAINYHISYCRGLSESYNGLWTSQYSILNPAVTFGLFTAIWHLSQVTPLFTKMPNPPNLSQSQWAIELIDLLQYVMRIWYSE